MDSQASINSLLLLITLIFGLVRVLVGTDTIGDVTYQEGRAVLNTNLSDVISDDWMFAEIRLPGPSSAVQCGVECVQDRRCVTFMVHLASGQCRLHAARVTFRSLLVPTEGFVSFDTSRAPRYIGDLCTNSSMDCDQANTTCFNGVCQCDVGYSFSPVLQRCILECPKYGRDFVPFESYYITEHNDLTLSDPYHLVRAHCLQACVETTNFTCRTVELSLNDCFLSMATKEHDPSTFYKTLTRTITHYQRQCHYDV